MKKMSVKDITAKGIGMVCGYGASTIASSACKKAIDIAPLPPVTQIAVACGEIAISTITFAVVEGTMEQTVKETFDAVDKLKAKVFKKGTKPTEESTTKEPEMAA